MTAAPLRLPSARCVCAGETACAQAGAARLWPDAGLHAVLPEHHRADPAVGTDLQDLHADLGPVLGGHQLAARAGVVPADLWRLVLRGAGQPGVWPADCLGAGALQVSGQEDRGCAGGPAVCAAHRRGRHLADRAAGGQWLDRPDTWSPWASSWRSSPRAS
jgi:hypothetical protein